MHARMTTSQKSNVLPTVRATAAARNPKSCALFVENRSCARNAVNGASTCTLGVIVSGRWIASPQSVGADRLAELRRDCVHHDGGRDDESHRTGFRGRHSRQTARSHYQFAKTQKK